ncbi:MAG: dockerin type I domain-containing protein [bacterium]|nr:dockerin type I domain-containing protein [bacterium]
MTRIFFWSLFCFLVFASAAFADELSSSGFKVFDSVMFSGGFASSTSFQLFSSFAEFVLGTSTSASFEVRPGFLFYPFASSPVVTATAGAGQVSLSWTASAGVLGWTVSGYNVGQSTTSGGPYSYSVSLGNVTSSTRTGLSNGTTYYFVVRAEDAFVNSVATSSEVSATPAAAATPAPSGGGGGGGGGGGPLSSVTRISLKGRSYPGATVTVLKDGAFLEAVPVDTFGNWRLDKDLASAGTYTFSIYSTDRENNRSLTLSFTTYVSPSQTTTVSDIATAPTIVADKSEVKFGSDIKFFGYAYPASDVNVIINSEHSLYATTSSDKLGFWDFVFGSGNLGKGEHTTKSQFETSDGVKSPFSESLAFRIGDTNVPFGKVSRLPLPAAPAAARKPGDINGDSRINIVDFSIMLFFWNQRNPQNPAADINKDGIANLFDFSIMLFWWSG